MEIPMNDNAEEPVASSISTSLRHDEPRRFVLRLIFLIGFPILFVVGAGEIVVWRLADGFVPYAIAQRQHDRPNDAWIGPFSLYPAVKVARAQLEEPDILFLGASRAGQFRSAMFKPYSFYNAGFSAWTFRRLLEMLKLASVRRQPKVIIVNIDFLIFQEAEVKRRASEEGETLLECSTRCANWKALHSLSQAFNEYPRDTTITVAKQMAGLRGGELDGFRLFGLTTESGSQGAFLYDGSMHYFPEVIAGAPGIIRRAGLLELAKNNRSDHLDVGQLRELDDFAQYARQRGIAVIGVQMPLDLRRLELSGDAEESMNAKSDTNADSSHMNVLKIFESAETRNLFESMGVHFIDLVHLPEAMNSRAFVEPFHPGEYLVLASVIAMLKDPLIGKLLPQIDIKALERRKAAAEVAGNYFNVFGHEF